MLAERAETEITAMRSEFPSLEAWADHLDRTAGDDFWPQFDAGMAAGLTGDEDGARRWLARVVQTDDDRDWAVAARRDAEALGALAGDMGAFTESAKERARTMRGHLGLPRDFDSRR
jgi:hypothetical protein